MKSSRRQLNESPRLYSLVKTDRASTRNSTSDSDGVVLYYPAIFSVLVTVVISAGQPISLPTLFADEPIRIISWTRSTSSRFAPFEFLDGELHFYRFIPPELSNLFPKLVEANESPNLELPSMTITKVSTEASVCDAEKSCLRKEWRGKICTFIITAVRQKSELLAL